MYTFEAVGYNLPGIQQCSTQEVVCTRYTVYSVQQYIRLPPRWRVHSMQCMRLTSVISVHSVQHSITAYTLFTTDCV